MTDKKCSVCGNSIEGEGHSPVDMKGPMCWPCYSAMEGV